MMNAAEPKTMPCAAPENAAMPFAAEDARVRRLRIIREVLITASGKAFGRNLRGVVLTGSVARGEESVLIGPLGETMLSDVECIVVLHNGVKLPDAGAREALCRNMELRLANRRLRTQVSAGVTHEDYLRNLPPHIFSYELKACGDVQGDPGLLTLIPSFGPSDIAREDAWRLLNNRIIEQLALVSEAGPQAGGLSDSLHYATVKLCLDLATSLLVFLGQYEPTYRGREERWRHMAASAPAELPFSASAFAARLRQCTQWKLAPQENARERDPKFWFEIAGYARQAWLWELRRLVAAPTDIKQPMDGQLGGDVEAMFRQLARSTGNAARMRGWAYAVRRRGWLRSLPGWPRWFRLGMCYSPRYAIYLAGFLLFERLLAGGPAMARSAGSPANAVVAGLGESKRRRVLALLPVRSACGPELSWQQAVADVTANYREFVTGTRA
jgi:hypothetical protein